MIPKDRQDEVQSALQRFVTLANRRNDAVVQYNGQIQFLVQLENTLRSCEGESRRLGGKALSLTPDLPAIYFWLQRLKSTTQLDIMKRLNYGGRALAFWGPLNVTEVTFAPPGPLDGYLELLGYQNHLEELFEGLFDTQITGVWYYWPDIDRLTEPGLVVDVSSVVQDLKDPSSDEISSNDDDDDGVYKAVVTIMPDSLAAFADMAKIRIFQVRVWLKGAMFEADSQGQSVIRIEIQHMGNETIWTQDGTAYSFDHSPVSLQFAYDCSLFNKEGKVSGSPRLVHGKQDIEHDYSGSGKPTMNDRPPLGPFTDWQIVMRRDTNPGLDLSKLEKVWIEFCGRNLAMTSKPKKPVTEYDFG